MILSLLFMAQEDISHRALYSIYNDEVVEQIILFPTQSVKSNPF